MPRRQPEGIMVRHPRHSKRKKDHNEPSQKKKEKEGKLRWTCTVIGKGDVAT